MMEDIVGIDLGTTNSEIAVYRNGRPESPDCAASGSRRRQERAE
jgi:molecular chaperone DnaK (HSP70)